ncbi:MAG: NUDIX hydrolase [Calditerrivibrio sp.]|nr:NUDIX hydrolase [Calditerrivibrio sp.]MCA1980307.1 NUDIX hydrolase [Calditerrivibrio sp.]
MHTYWNFLKKVDNFQDRVLTISHRYWEFTKKGVSAPFTSIDTIDWVVIIPTLKSGEFVLVEQFRPVVESVTIEFPGGGINNNEPPIDAAIRELEEETSLRAEEIREIGILRPNPAIMSNTCYVYHAKNCTFSGSYNFDQFEDINVKTYSKEMLERMIISGEINHSIVVASYALYKLI